MRILIFGGSNGVLAGGYVDGLVRLLKGDRHIAIEALENRCAGGSTSVYGLEAAKSIKDVRAFDTAFIEYCGNDLKLDSKKSSPTLQGAVEGLIRFLLNSNPAMKIYLLKFGRNFEAADQIARQQRMFRYADELASNYGKTHFVKAIDVDGYIRSLVPQQHSLDSLYRDISHYSIPLATSLISKYIAQFVSDEAVLPTSSSLPQPLCFWAFEDVIVMNAPEILPGRQIKPFKTLRFSLETVVIGAGEEITLELPGSLLSLSFSSAVDSGALLVTEEGFEPFAFDTRHSRIDGQKYHFLVLRNFVCQWKAWADSGDQGARKVTLRVLNAEERRSLVGFRFEKRSQMVPMVPKTDEKPVVYLGRITCTAPAHPANYAPERKGADRTAAVLLSNVAAKTGVTTLPSGSASVSPYKGLPPDRFWSSGVTSEHPLTVKDLYRKRFPITSANSIGTAGSCFAQHIAGHLRRTGYSVLDLEPAPAEMSESSAKKYGYRIYSARYGNIYLARQLLQLHEEANSGVPRSDIVWQKAGRYFDALRPGVEPDGLDSPEEVLLHRQRHLERVRELFHKMDVFIFTFGLTEGWIHKESGVVYPTCPGTIAGTFDPKIHAFKNFTAEEIRQDFIEFRRRIHQHNPKVKFLVTVSPVPLKATAAGKHVLVATTYSKSVLRAVAGELYETCDDVDYFPSYEIISSPWSRGFFFAPDMREVTPAGVEAVMRVFSSEHPPARKEIPVRERPETKIDDDELVCEEELLGAFAPDAAGS